VDRFAVNQCQCSQFCYRRRFALEIPGFDRFAAKETDIADTSSCCYNLTLPTQHSTGSPAPLEPHGSLKAVPPAMIKVTANLT
jgi:hypothetical protein